MIEAYLLYAALFLFPALFVPPARRRTLSALAAALGLSLKPIRPTLALALFGLAGLFVASAVGVQAAAFAGFDDSARVAATVAGLGPLGLLLVVSLGPLAEETFFRGFLQLKAGLLPAAVAFGVLHYAFGSVAVVLAAFLSALVLGRLFKKSGNLWACVLAHAAFNTLNVAFVLIPIV
ncbi:MAG: type II CAAX endopeptidase family protein [Candidatus Micrarchaeota archaeon]|nr:type II CAAX endopeptidase family protein [Candidatus Micrarchaeota archaeon]